MISMQLPISQGARVATLGMGGSVFAPNSLAGLQAWFKADIGLTLYTTAYSADGTISQSGNNITGSGSAFLGTVKVGDLITGAGTGISGTVTSITDDTHMAISSSATLGSTTFTTTPQAGSSDRVTTWADQSTNARDLTQSTAKQKPMKNSTGQNGIPTLRFDGYNSFGYGDSFTSLSFTLTQPATLFLVVKQITWISSGYICDGGAADAMVLFQSGTTPQIKAYAGTASSAISLTLNTWGIVCCIYNGASSSLRLNADTAVTGNFGAASPSGFTLGGRQTGGSKANMEIGEAVLYNTALSAGDETSVRQYLNNRWGTY